MNTLKQALQKQDLTLVTDTLQPKHVCDICSKVCFSKAGLASHMKSNNKLSNACFTKVFL